MANNGPNACLKLFLIVINFLFLLVGIAILSVGIYLCTNGSLSKYSDVFSGMDSLRSIRYILIGCGTFVLIVGFCGFAGACKESKCLLVLYLLLLLVILFANVAAVALSVVYNKQAKSYVMEQVKDQFKRLYGNNSEPASKLFTDNIDKIQKDEACCGWTGLDTPNFYLSTPWYQQQVRDKTGQVFPESCCPEGVLSVPEKRNQCVKATDEGKAREDGFMNAEDCSEKFMNLNSRFMHIVLGVVILAIVLQVICITCAGIIVRQVSNMEAGRVV